jgi:hypothetical protein
MFVAFIQKKGWLKFEGSTDYLNALWQSYRQEKEDGNFYGDRLSYLFFEGLNKLPQQNLSTEVSIDFVSRSESPQPPLKRGAKSPKVPLSKGDLGGFLPISLSHDRPLSQRIGTVPYLNGGLFEQDADEKDPKIFIPDDSIELILTELFDKFNFTVTESTPLDEEVAVDPEMLGKVFEELVNNRHGSGSYYTPKPIVSFMCREALKGYLKTKVADGTQDAIAKFVDEHNADNLTNRKQILDNLKSIRTVDPACGSGAYLLGMLHELLDLWHGVS